MSNNYSNIYKVLQTIDDKSTSFYDVNVENDLSVTKDLSIGGNLTVNGTQTIIDTQTLTIEDPIIILNRNSAAVPVSNSGIEVERGDSTNARLIWNEETDRFQCGLVGAERNICVLNTAILNTGLLTYNSSLNELMMHNGLTFASSTLSAPGMLCSGNLGVGTTTASARLHINDTADAVIYTRTAGLNRNSILRLHAANDGNRLQTGNAIIQFGTKESTSLSPDNSWYFGTHSSAGVHDFDVPLKIGFRGGVWGLPGDNDFLTISASGNLGVGTTVPTSRLHVTGNSLLSGDISIQPFYEWPPVAMTADATTLSNQTYGNGSYTASVSGSIGTPNEAFRLFDKSVSTLWSTAAASYSTLTGEIGNYLGSISTTYNTSLTYLGEWLQISLPTSISLQSFSITAQNALTGSRAPRNFRIFGSTNGTTWTSIGNEFVNEDFAQGQIKTFVVNNTINYSIFRLVVNRRDNVTTSTGALQIAEIRLFGIPSSTTTFCTSLENVGIGTNAPSAKLHIVQTGTANCFRVDDETSDVTFFSINLDGQVGISTSLVSSGAILDISSTSLGVRLPMLTTISRNALTTEGLFCYDSTLQAPVFRNNLGWVEQRNVLEELYYNFSTGTTSTTLSNLATNYRLSTEVNMTSVPSSGNLFTNNGSAYINWLYTGTNLNSRYFKYMLKISFFLDSASEKLTFSVYKNATFSGNTYSSGGTVIMSSFTQIHSSATAGNSSACELSFIDITAANDVYTLVVLYGNTGKKLTVNHCNVICETYY